MGLCYSRTDKTTRKETGATSTATTTAERPNSGRWRKPRDLNSGGEIDEIQQVVGRLVGNGSSKIACLHTQQGRKGTNQDAMLVWEVGVLLSFALYSVSNFTFFRVWFHRDEMCDRFASLVEESSYVVLFFVAICVVLS